MVKLSIIDLESISGGTWSDFVDGFCAGAGAAVLISSAVTGVSAPVAGAVAIGCGGWGLYRALS